MKGTKPLQLGALQNEDCSAPTFYLQTTRKRADLLHGSDEKRLSCGKPPQPGRFSLFISLFCNMPRKSRLPEEFWILWAAAETGIRLGEGFSPTRDAFHLPGGSALRSAKALKLPSV